MGQVTGYTVGKQQHIPTTGERTAEDLSFSFDMCRRGALTPDTSLITLHGEDSAIAVVLVSKTGSIEARYAGQIATMDAPPINTWVNVTTRLPKSAGSEPKIWWKEVSR